MRRSGTFREVLGLAAGLFLFATASEARAERTGLEPVGQWGGPSQTVAVVGDLAYVGMGPSLLVLDITQPANPVRLGQVLLPDFVWGIAVAGSYAYVADGAYGGLQVIDVSNPAAPVRVGAYDTSGYAEDVAVAGGYAYVADRDAGLHVIDVTNPSTPTWVGGYDTSGSAYGVAVAGNYAYVADHSAGLQVIDISDPIHPVWVGGYTTSGTAKGVAVAGGYSYVADDNMGLQVIDISIPSDPVWVSVCDTAGHATRVAVGGAYAYVADDHAGLQVINISNAASPTRVGGYDTSGEARGVAVGGTHVYVADRFGGLQVISVSNPAGPVRVGGYATGGYSYAVAASGRYAYSAEGDVGLQIIDVADPAGPEWVGRYNTTGLAAGVAVVGVYAYVADEMAGLQVINVANPAAPVREGGYDTMGSAHDVAVARAYAYVADRNWGLQVINISNPTAPFRVGGCDTSGSALGVAVNWPYAYMADEDSGLQIINASNPASPLPMGAYNTSGTAYRVAVAGRYAYVADGASGLQVIDVMNPALPVGVGFYDTPGTAYSVVVVGFSAYVADGSSGLLVLNILNPTAPVSQGGYDTAGLALDVAVEGAYAYVADSDGGVVVLRLGPSDCNNNGIADDDDIAGGTSRDCNSDGLPDECSGGPDCNGNGILDECDITAGTSTDCQLNGVPDECEGGADCNGNGILDECDLAAGTSADCQVNGIPDECDLAAGTSYDCQPNGAPDECEEDCNSNGIADECDLVVGTSRDCNQDGIPDECGGGAGTSVAEPDDFAAGTVVDTAWPGVVLSAVTSSGGPSGDGHVYVRSGTYVSTGTRMFGNSVLTGSGDTWCYNVRLRATFSPSTSFVSIDAIGDDPDEDSTLVAYSSQGAVLETVTVYPNGGGTIKTMAVTRPTADIAYVLAWGDCNNLDHLVFGREVGDCNSNGIPDDCELAAGSSADCQSNGILDECDIAGGTSTDMDTNGIPDECLCPVPPAPADPIPSNGATNVPAETNLAWNGEARGPGGTYTEDFNDGQAQGWQEDVDGDWQVISNEYRAFQAVPTEFNSMVATYGAAVFHNVICEAKIRSAEAANPRYLLFRATADFETHPTRSGSAYAFGIGGTQYYIYKQIAGTLTTIQGWTFSAAINPSTSWNTLKVVADGPVLEFYINNTLVQTVTDSSLSSGRIGLLGFTFPGYVQHHYFDDVSVIPVARSSGAVSALQQWYNDHPREGGTPENAPSSASVPQPPAGLLQGTARSSDVPGGDVQDPRGPHHEVSGAFRAGVSTGGPANLSEGWAPRERVPLTFATPRLSVELGAPANVLLLASGTGVTVLQTALASYADIGTVDYFDSSVFPPTLANLTPYDVVVTMSNEYHASPVQTGNVLADYVDAGGKVIQAEGTFATGGGWELAGRFVTAGSYEPFFHGPVEYFTHSLGAFDSGHPIMAGITTLSDGYPAEVGLRSGAVWVASWNNGRPLVATRGASVVGINLFAFDSGDYTGDVPLLFRNAVVWLLGGSPGGCPLTYDVYFGTDNPPSTLICDDSTGTTCDPPGLLAAVTTYYWQVIATTPTGSTAGPVWSFTTEPCLPDIRIEPTALTINEVLGGGVPPRADGEAETTEAYGHGNELRSGGRQSTGAASPVIDPEIPWWETHRPQGWCATVERYLARARARGWSEERALCDPLGVCDDPVERDAAIPEAGTPIKVYRVSLHVFCEDSGANCLATQAEVDAQMATMNASFLPWRVQFIYETEFVNTSQFRNFYPSEEAAMKSAYSDAPDEKLNVYLVYNYDAYSWGTFPWDPDALTYIGGIVMDDRMFGPGVNILTHEVGHCIGLWHTHHGVSEVTGCDGCHEPAGGANGDTTGDRCSDTDPTPVNYSCAPPGGSDYCNGIAWGDTDYHNYMGYAPSSCMTEYTPQQSGRYHCWTGDVLAGWLASGQAGFAIRNDGECDLVVSAITAESGAGWLSFSPAPPYTISPGDVQLVDVAVDFSLLLCPQDTDRLLVVSNDPDESPYPGGVNVQANCHPCRMVPGDCQPNGVPDACDLAAGSSADCNTNGVPDECDVAGGTSGDCNVNGTLDECELISGGTYLHQTGTITPFRSGSPAVVPLPSPVPAMGDVTVTAWARADLDHYDEYVNVSIDGTPVGRLFDAAGTQCPSSDDVDGLTIPRAMFNAALPGGVTITLTPTPDVGYCSGTVQVAVSYRGEGGDCNSNGILDECDIAAGMSWDCQPNGILDECEIGEGTSADCNGGGIPDECDLAGGTSWDWDNNGIPDECQDCQPNGLPDFIDLHYGISEDCNLNATPDECDIAAGTSRDCNTNGTPDACDITGGTSQDTNGNGTPDECEMPAQWISAVPGDQSSLWRSAKNTIRLTFDGDVTAPASGQVLIQQMLEGGTFGPDVSAEFSFTVETVDIGGGVMRPRVLKIRETGASTVLTHRTWIAIRNAETPKRRNRKVKKSKSRKVERGWLGGGRALRGAVRGDGR